MRDGVGRTVRTLHSFSKAFFVRKTSEWDKCWGGRGLLAHLERFRVFVDLAGRFIVIERVPEDQTQILIDF